MEIAHLMHNFVFALDRGADQKLQSQFGLGFSQFLILSILSKHGNMSQKEAASCVNITPGGVSRHVNTLVEQGYISRTINKHNRREHIIQIMPKGEQIEKKGYLLLDSELNQLFQHIPDGELDQMKRNLSTLLNAMGELPVLPDKPVK
jgi:DNA-binding MarR family transcriptional regulator